MTVVSDLRNASITFSEVSDARGVHLQLVVDGVNKTFAGRCEQGDFYLRLSPSRLHSAEDLQSEARTLEYIAAYDTTLVASPFLGAQQAGTAFAWNGETYHGIATAVAHGSPCDESTAQLILFGTALARLHSVPLSTNSETGATGTPERSWYSDNGKAGRLRSQISLLREVAAAWLDDGRPINSGTNSIRHGDAWPGNARFAPSRVTLFDFEHTSVGDPVMDIANLAWWLTGLEQSPEHKAELWCSFLYGYRQLGNAPQPDLSCLPFHVLSAELRSLHFLDEFVQLSPEVEHAILSGTRNIVSTWGSREVSADGNLTAGW